MNCSEFLVHCLSMPLDCLAIHIHPFILYRFFSPYGTIQIFFSLWYHYTVGFFNDFEFIFGFPFTAEMWKLWRGFRKMAIFTINGRSPNYNTACLTLIYTVKRWAWFKHYKNLRSYLGLLRVVYV